MEVEALLWKRFSPNPLIEELILNLKKMLKLENFKTGKIDTSKIVGVEKHYTKNPATGSTIDIITDENFKDATGRREY